MARLDMGKVRKFGLTAVSMKVLGSAIRLMALGNTGAPVETDTKAIG